MVESNACYQVWVIDDGIGSAGCAGDLGVLATDVGGAAAGLGTSRFHSLVIDNRVPVRTMQSLYFTVTVLALNNAVHP
jgi:hypothetical protein